MYYHGVINGLVTDKVRSILNQKQICSSKQMGISKKIGFNEEEYISVCRNLGEEVYKEYPNNAYNKYIVNRFFFVISDEIVAERPVLIDTTSMSMLDLFNLRRANPDKRFSDIVDEYQVKGSIPFSHVIAIGIPYDLTENNGFIKLSDFCYLTPDEYQLFVCEIEDMANAIGLEIINSSDLKTQNPPSKIIKIMQKINN